MDTSFLDALAVPHLALMCAELHSVKELWSVCAEGRRQAATLFTGMTVDCDTAFPDAADRGNLVRMLSKCQLSRIGVILPLGEGLGKDGELLI